MSYNNNSPQTLLVIRKLELNVRLGWTEQERQHAQTVHVDIFIQSAKPPLACSSDDLNDTICYATLINLIHKNLANSVFKLIEHLAQQLTEFIKTSLPSDTNVNLQVTKYPAVQGLLDGISFQYGDAIKTIC